MVGYLFTLGFVGLILIDLVIVCLLLVIRFDCLDWFCWVDAFLFGVCICYLLVCVVCCLLLSLFVHCICFYCYVAYVVVLMLVWWFLLFVGCVWCWLVRVLFWFYLVMFVDCLRDLTLMGCRF